MWIEQWFVQADAQLRKTTLKLSRKPATVITFIALCSLGVLFVWLPSLLNLKESSNLFINEKPICGTTNLEGSWDNSDCTLLAYTPKNPTTDSIIERMRTKYNYGTSEIVGYDSLQQIAAAVFKNTGTMPFVANFINTDPASFEINLHANLTVASVDQYGATYNKPNKNLIKIQHQLDTAALEIINSSVGDDTVIDVDIEFTSFPYYEDVSTIGNFFSLMFMPTSLTMGILMASMIAMYLVLSEKKDGMLKMMRTMGLCESTFWFTWAIGFALLAAVGAIVPALLARLTDIVALEKIKFGVLLLIFAVFFWSVTMFNVMFVSFSNRVALIGMGTMIIFGFVMIVLDVINGILMISYLAGFEQSGSGFKSFYLKLLYSPNTATVWRTITRSSPVFGFAKIMSNVIAVTSGAGSRSKTNGAMIATEYGWDQFTAKIGPYYHNDKQWWGASDADTCLLIALECIGYTLFAWYMAQVWGGGNKKFYFFLQPSYWGLVSQKSQIRSGDTVGKAKASSEKMQSIRLVKLSKGFKGIQAVKELSLNMKMGETFCLLGHNGAGKTTTINVLTGVHKPTFGHAFVLGHSVQDEIGSIQRLMGICPQHDILFEELSGADHIKFWARFKGMDRSKLNEEVERALNAVNLYSDAKQAAGKYSGGMQRRLSVAISTLGSPKVIFLDEPTTGMDPLTRRKVWGTINDLKKNAILVLTTHSMEEADALGDNIAIMANGSLRAVGSSLFLKDKFGQGSQVNLITDMSNTDHIEKLASDFVPASTLVSSSAGNMTFSIPNISRRRLPAFFEALEDPSNGISEWGISSTTLEEVFVRLTKANKSSSAEGDIEDDLDSEKKCKICEIRPVTRVQLMTGKGIGLWVDGVICQHCARTPEEVRADEEKEAIEYQEREKAKQEELKTLREAIVKEVNETFIVLQNTETAATADNTRQTPAVQTKIYELKKKIYDLQQQHGDYASVIAQQQQEFAQQQQQQQVKMIRQESIDTKQPLSEAGITVKVPTAVEEANMSKPQLSPQVVMVGSTETDEEENRKPTVVGTAANISVVPTASKQFKALTMKNMNLIKRQKKTMACFLYCACQIVTMLFLTAGVGSIVSVEGNYNHKCGSYKAQVECSKLATAFEQHGLGYAYIYGKNDGDFNWNMIWNTEFYTPSILDVDSRDLWYSQKAQSSDTLVKDLLFYDGFATPFVNFKNFDTVSSLKELSEPVRVGQETMNSREFKVNITEVDTVLESYFPLFAMYVDKLNTKGDNLEFDGKFNDYGPTDNKWYDFEVNFLDDKGKLMDDMIYWMGSTHSANTMRARMNMIQWVKYALLKTAAKATSKVVNMVKTNIYDFGDMIAFENYPSVAPTVCSGLILLGQFFIPHFVQQITMEKESKLISALRMQGMRMGSYHLSNYFFVQLLVMIPTFIVIVCMLLAKVKLGQSILYWIISVPCWAHSTSGLALTMPSFFRSSKIAVIVMFITVYMSANISSILIAVVKDFPWWVSYIPIFQGAKLIRDLLNKTTSTETIMSTLGNMLLSGTVLLLIGIVMENIALGIWKPHRFISHLKTKSKNRKERRVGSAKRQTTADTINNPTNDEITIQVQNKNDAEDEDVLEESIKADKATSKDNPIIVRHMKKNFGPKQAVKDVSFVGDQGQCFGLLGPNGAGKTTTLSMMSGTLSIGGGEAIISGFDVETELQKVYTVLGMSPQFDRLYEEMTVEEHLKVYSTLRGVNPSGVTIVSRQAAENVELDGDQFRMISRQLSGGMKRRLSLAIALCAMPKVVFLDEPTTGLDPQTRQQIWQIVHNLKKDRCLILTTHSMEEADTLCDRIGIMALGSMRCVGTNMHLKHKFGQGLHLKVNLKHGASDDRLCEYLQTVSEQSKMVYSFGNGRTFMIPSDVKISKLYRELDHLAKSLDIDEWAINQASLEEVFVRIAKDSEKTDNDTNDVQEQ